MNKELAILDYRTGEVHLYSLPQHVQSDQDIEDYVLLTLDLNPDCQWLVAPKVKLFDFRTKEAK